MENIEPALLKVGKDTGCSGLSSSIFSTYEENNERKIILRAIGAGALNQAVKAAISSNRYFSRYSLHVHLVPSFRIIEENCTCIELEVKLQKNGG